MNGDNDFQRTGTLITGGWFKLLDADGNVIYEGNKPEVVTAVQLKEIA